MQYYVKPHVYNSSSQFFFFKNSYFVIAWQLYLPLKVP